ncbi:hypothetical protein GCM10008922_33700 [Faecalicatena contorta]
MRLKQRRNAEKLGSLPHAGNRLSGFSVGSSGRQEKDCALGVAIRWQQMNPLYSILCKLERLLLN